MKARVGITTTPALQEEVLREKITRAYVTAVKRAGAVPFVLPILEPGDAETVVASLDALVLSGGGDVDPSLYGQIAVPEVDGLDAGRDAYELALLGAALTLGIPVLGICRGAQLINVARGGTLVQHLPGVTELSHREKDRVAEAVHTVDVAPDSFLATVTGSTVLGVNSLHHQAVDRVGAGLRVVGRAPDGVVEAIESAGPERLLGVQWHPELLVEDAAHVALFEWLVHEAVGPSVVTTFPVAADAADEPAPLATAVA
jgi:putative glutamine amidotransferase